MYFYQRCAESRSASDENSTRNDEQQERNIQYSVLKPAPPRPSSDRICLLPLHLTPLLHVHVMQPQRGVGHYFIAIPNSYHLLKSESLPLFYQETQQSH